jgi:hypothetical protein
MSASLAEAHRESPSRCARLVQREYRWHSNLNFDPLFQPILALYGSEQFVPLT